MMKYIKAAAHRFSREDKGTMTVETVLIMPILMWWVAASLMFFDAYKARNVNLKAAYTMSDMLTREMMLDEDESVIPIDESYINGLHNVFNYLTAGHGVNSYMRVSVIRCDDNCAAEDAASKDLHTEWSYDTEAVFVSHTGDVYNLGKHIPIMANKDVVIVVETKVDYSPAFNVGLTDQNFENVIVAKLRFSPTLCWKDVACGSSPSS